MCVMEAGHVRDDGRTCVSWRQGTCVMEAGHVR